jgi:hypothetical protein
MIPTFISLDAFSSPGTNSRLAFRRYSEQLLDLFLIAYALCRLTFFYLNDTLKPLGSLADTRRVLSAKDSFSFLV